MPAVQARIHGGCFVNLIFDDFDSCPLPRPFQSITQNVWLLSAGHQAAVEALVYNSCNVNATNSGGLTPLVGATLNNHAGIVNVLLRTGANPLGNQAEAGERRRTGSM